MSPKSGHLFSLLILIGGSLFFPSSLRGAPQKFLWTQPSPWEMCATQIAAFEQAYQFPQGLLSAISLIETGRLNPAKGEIQAWPWTINVAGKGYVFDTKPQAVAEVKKLLTKGTQSIDIGCMQVNLKWHPQAFVSVEQAFEPHFNVAYAARFLAQLQAEHGNWENAIGSYHSYTKDLAASYRGKVLAQWNNELAKVIRLGNGKLSAPSSAPMTQVGLKTPLNPPKMASKKQPLLPLAQSQAPSRLQPNPEVAKYLPLFTQTKTTPLPTVIPLPTPKTPAPSVQPKPSDLSQMIMKAKLPEEKTPSESNNSDSNGQPEPKFFTLPKR